MQHNEHGAPRFGTVRLRKVNPVIEVHARSLIDSSRTAGKIGQRRVGHEWVLVVVENYQKNECDRWALRASGMMKNGGTMPNACAHNGADPTLTRPSHPGRRNHAEPRQQP